MKRIWRSFCCLFGFHEWVVIGHTHCHGHLFRKQHAKVCNEESRCLHCTAERIRVITLPWEE